MVLDKLSSSLRSILKKVARAGFVDKRLIEELVKEIQKALLYADVNVKLVLNLTKNIKERALNEKPPAAITQKEYLIKIVYEELAKFLGEEKKELSLKNKPSKVMFLGLYGAGKCVHAKSKIPLTKGDILEAEELYENYRYLSKEKLEDGEIMDVSNESVFVPSFNPKTLKIESKKVTHLWKLQGKNLINVSLDNGNNFSVKVTPEHPFFVLRMGDLKQIRADELTEDDYIAIPKTYQIQERNSIYLLNYLKKLDLDVYLNFEEINKKTKNKSKKGLCKNLKFKRNYCYFIHNLKKGRMPMELVDSINGPSIKIKLNNSNKTIFFPMYMNVELAEFIGYVVGDGHLGKGYIDIFTEDNEIIERIKYLSKTLFGINPTIEPDKRTKALHRIRIISKTLVTIFNKSFDISIGKKGDKLNVPKQIINSPDDVVKVFLRAYFDCDSYAAKFSREIEVTSESKELIEIVALLLLRFSILSNKSSKNIKNKPYFRLNIRARYAELYSKTIGFRVNKKKKRADNFETIGIRQGCGKQDLIPLADNLKDLRESLGFSIGELQSNGVNSYGRYEQFGIISKEKLSKTIDLYHRREGNIKKFLLNINNLKMHHSKPAINSLLHHLKTTRLLGEENKTVFLTKDGQLFLSKIKFKGTNTLLEFVKNLSESDICWSRVNSITQIKNDDNFVYDLTVEDNHSFIADGIIVHNTTTISKLADYYKKRGKKVALLALDVHRPAGILQLEQLGKKVNAPVFSDKKEKDPVKIYKKFQDKYSKFDLLLIDTAGRDALSKDLIKEIETLNKTIKPDERILVVSADIGQAAESQAKKFHETVNITGVILTKLDGTAKGGGSLSACAVSGAPIKFIGVGEKPEDIEEFNPQGFVGRLLGMGDLEALLEKAKEAISEEEAEDLGKKFLKGEFNFLDLYEQMSAMKKMGPLTKILDMIPGMGNVKIPKEMLEVQEEKMQKWKFILQSCTKEELENPDTLTTNRIERIAKGSGTTTSEVRGLLKQYKQAKKLMKTMKGQDPSKLMKKFKGKVPGF